MKDMIEILLKKHDDKIGGQILFANGAQMAGSVRRTEVDGMYELFTVGQNNQTKQAVTVHSFFKAESLVAFNLVEEHLVQPVNGAVKIVSQ